MKLFRKLVFLSSVCNVVNSFVPKVSPMVSKVVIKQASAFLPAVDTIGHNVLNFNREAINQIIDVNYLTPEIKKVIIISLIELAQGGDMMGSVFLTIYHNLVCFLL